MTADQIYQYLQRPEKLNRDTILSMRELTEQYPAFETGWLLYLKNLKNIESPIFEKELINGAIRIHDRRKLYLFLNGKSATAREVNPAQEPKLEETQDKYGIFFPSEYKLEVEAESLGSIGDIAHSIQENSEKKNTLIEKFLEEKPIMTPVKGMENSSPMENVKPNESDDDDFFTETLALIYSRQGYYKKAIHIFEKLSLKYPEKSTYFAGHIEKIKNLMNN